MSENVLSIRQSNKLHHGSHERQETEINSERKNFSRSENPQRHLLT